jgi:hypothetical protein
VKGFAIYSSAVMTTSLLIPTEGMAADGRRQTAQCAICRIEMKRRNAALLRVMKGEKDI